MKIQDEINEAFAYSISECAEFSGTEVKEILDEIRTDLENRVKNLGLFRVSGYSLDELKLLKDCYTERTERAGKAQNYREAHEDNIRTGVVEHIMALVNNR